jgi:hypothetical protein
MSVNTRTTRSVARALTVQTTVDSRFSSETDQLFQPYSGAGPAWCGRIAALTTEAVHELTAEWPRHRTAVVSQVEPRE